jgi:hypothetical protein
VALLGLLDNLKQLGPQRHVVLGRLGYGGILE